MLYSKIPKINKISISIIDGITLGGGVGLSQGCKIRICTENTLLAMPECKIGLITDAGSCFYFRKIRKNIGLYLLLTG